MESSSKIKNYLQNKNIKKAISLLELELIKRRSFNLKKLSPIEQFEMLKRRSLQIIPEDKLLDKLKLSRNNKKPLEVKFGIDPTGSEIHIGHAVPMIIVNRLQRMGHKITFVVGDFTAKIGDPSERITSRPPLTDKQIKRNLATYQDQVRPFFDFSKAKIVYNSKWLNNIKLADFFSLLSKVNISESLQREDFKKRLKDGHGLTHAEFLYSIAMAIDSVHLKTEIEIGGVDQLLNLQMCRKLMEIQDIEPECIITTDLLPGITGDGRKMSKTYNNYIALNHSPDEIYGKIMSIPDSLLETYYKALTEITNEEWREIQKQMTKNILNPMDLKKLLGRLLVTILYNKKSAENAEKDFELKFSKKIYDKIKDVKKFQVNKNKLIIEFLVQENLIKSKSEARRLSKSGGIQIVLKENKLNKIKDINGSFKDIGIDNFLLKIGKQNIVRIELVKN